MIDYIRCPYCWSSDTEECESDEERIDLSNATHHCFDCNNDFSVVRTQEIEVLIKVEG